MTNHPLSSEIRAALKDYVLFSKDEKRQLEVTKSTLALLFDILRAVGHDGLSLGGDSCKALLTSVDSAYDSLINVLDLGRTVDDVLREGGQYGE